MVCPVLRGEPSLFSRPTLFSLPSPIAPSILITIARAFNLILKIQRLCLLSSSRDRPKLFMLSKESDKSAVKVLKSMVAAKKKIKLGPYLLTQNWIQLF